MILAGRTAVVTGSSSGIGKAIALEFAQQGANLILHGRADSNHLNEVENTIAQMGRKVSICCQDFSEDFDEKTFVSSCLSAFGTFDIWVNNAGADVLTEAKASWPMRKKFDHLMQTDVATTLFLTREAGRWMSENGSGDLAILNIGWDQAWQGMEGDSGELFAATKGAIMSTSKSLAASMAPKVRVNCIAPGWIQTKWGETVNEYWDARAQRESLMERWGQPTDVAQTAAFLCSSQSSFITGQIVNVNGGFNHGGRK